MRLRSGKRWACLLLMGFAVGCGSEESTPVVESELPAETQTVDADESLTAIESEDADEPSLSELDPSEAQMPELLVPVPSASAIDHEVQPAAAVGLPLVERLPSISQSLPPGSDALAELVEAYRTGQPERWTRAEAAIHAQGSAALPALCEGLSSPDQQTRELASMMLAQILPNLLYAENLSQRPDAAQLAGQLRQALRDHSAEVRVNVAVALSLMEGEGPALVPVLVELLGSEQPHIRTMAVSALGNLGASARIALPHIERLSQADTDPTTKAAALEASNQLRSIP